LFKNDNGKIALYVKETVAFRTEELELLKKKKLKKAEKLSKQDCKVAACDFTNRTMKQTRKRFNRKRGRKKRLIRVGRREGIKRKSTLQ